MAGVFKHWSDIKHGVAMNPQRGDERDKGVRERSENLVGKEKTMRSRWVGELQRKLCQDHLTLDTPDLIPYLQLNSYSALQHRM